MGEAKKAGQKGRQGKIAPRGFFILDISIIFDCFLREGGRAWPWYFWNFLDSILAVVFLSFTQFLFLPLLFLILLLSL